MDPKELQSAEDLEQAFHAWNILIYRYIYARVGQRGVAEDLAQDVFLKAWRSREQYNPKKASLKTWIFAVALNAVRDHCKARKNRPLEEIPEDLPSGEDSSAKADASVKRQQIARGLAKLSERDNQLIVLRFVDDLSLEEIAEVLDMRYNAVKVALHRAMERLRRACGSP